MEDDRADRIRRLNDALRRGGLGGRVMITTGISSLGDSGLPAILTAVSSFDGFNPDNDPWGEHDSAVLTVNGRRIMFKIDYYDASMTAASVDPADPHLTLRVMTIMLAEEY
jgi:hypothetical protein